MGRRICKRCLLQEEMPEDIAEYLDRFLKLIPDKERAGEYDYEKRIEICRSCPGRTGAVCMGCGCYVELRAAVAEQTCPYHRW